MNKCACGGDVFVDWWKNYRVVPARDEAFVRCTQCGETGRTAATEEDAIALWRMNGRDMKPHSSEAGSEMSS